MELIIPNQQDPEEHGDQPAGRKEIARLRRLTLAALNGACIDGAVDEVARNLSEERGLPVSAADVRKGIVDVANSADKVLY